MPILRPALLDDTAALAELGRSSFCAAFEHLYRPNDLRAFLERVYSEETVAQEIADPTIVHCLAEENGALAGFVKMRAPSWYAEDTDAADPIALGQLYTDPARTGQGIGAMLMNWALDHAQDRGHDSIQLSVWSENLGAQRFYRRYGFAKVKDIEFWVGEQCDHEFLFELRI